MLAGAQSLEGAWSCSCALSSPTKDSLVRSDVDMEVDVFAIYEQICRGKKIVRKNTNGQSLVGLVSFFFLF